MDKEKLKRVKLEEKLEEKLIPVILVYLIGMFTGIAIWFPLYHKCRMKLDKSEAKCNVATTETNGTETGENIHVLDIMILNDEIEEDGSNLDGIYNTLLSYEDRAKSDEIIRRNLEDAFTHITNEENYRKAMKLFDNGEYNNKDYLHSLRLFLNHPRYRKTLDKITYILYYRGNESPYDINELIKNDDEVVQMIYNKAETFYDHHDYYNAEILYYYVTGYKDSVEKHAIILGDNAKSSK